MTLHQLTYLRVFVVLAGVVLFRPTVALAACEAQVGAFVSLSGSVKVRSGSGDSWIDADLASKLCEGDTIRVGERSRAAVALINDAVLRIDQNTTMRLLDITDREEERSWLDLVKGAFQSFSRKPRFLSINTPYLNGSIEGTEFLVRVDNQTSEIIVFEGVVVAANNQGQVALSPGELARAVKGQAPQRRTVVRPRDQVKWTLYYPPILSAAAGSAGSAPMSKAEACAADGDTVCAFTALEQVPANARDAQFLLLRASMLLSVGRVGEARFDINEMLKRNTKSVQGHALRSVIAVTLNDKAAALADARRGVALGPDSTAAKIALSYALQADLQLEAARDTLLQAVEQHPDNPLVRARLAELHLMLGNRKQATAVAQRAVQLQPGLSRTQNALGFTALAEIRVKQAQAAFEQAIALDSADPLPRLGLGLAKIRQGKLVEGRRDLEAAVALDSNNALLRAYLGKAYFEEKRGPLDADQFAIAKALDPLDPTAYFYNAIRLQTENQPLAALRELEASIQRNDNRSVYHSRLLLDQDRAARGTSQARIYKDLGFNQLGVNAATRSMTQDPGNASAHRFLSDAYRDTTERTETARVSELLQSQMLQDVNINPVQPSVSATNLNIVTSGGPAEAGFNEFTPLFERNQLRADITGFLGNNDTVGGEAVVSGIYGPLSTSLGGFSYDTDGYRPNNDLEHEIWDLYGQWAISSEVNVQAEYRRRKTDHGDLRQNFDLKDFDDTFRRDLDADIWRFGGRISPTNSSDLLLSYIHSDVDSSGQSVPLDIPGVIRVTEDQSQNDEADQYEAQYLYRADRFNVLVGGAHADSDIDGAFTSTATIPPPAPVLPPNIFSTDSDIKDTRGYVYGNIQLSDAVLATLGVSYLNYNEDLVSDGITNDFEKWNPKLGIRWGITDTLTARAAYFKTVKPVLVSNRTLEPTQVAGFNQFFDDPNATRSTRYGAGLDWRPLSNLHIGGELTKRELESPAIDFSAGKAVYEDRDEWLHRLYLFWTPADRWSISGEVVFDKFTNVDNSLVADIVPDRVTTWTIPLKATYFHPSGWFAGAGVTYVDQEVRRDDSRSVLAQGDSSFTLVDAAIGYRLPRRRGLFSLSVQNLFDEEFDYQDNSYRTFSDQPYVSPYVPERTLLARFLLSF
ncbi:MAG: TonB-dependent receptor [Sulfitobacter sp.]|nr:TonB-dependent receptor [Sulfitobacter sp.]